MSRFRRATIILTGLAAVTAALVIANEARAQMNMAWCAYPAQVYARSSTTSATVNPCGFQPSQSDVSPAPASTPVEAAMQICHEHAYWKGTKRDKNGATQVWVYPDDWRDCNAVQKKWQGEQEALSKKLAADAADSESRDKRYVTAVAQGRIKPGAKP